MYAVIESGGKQHKVEKGMKLSVDLLQDEPGKKIIFDNVLLYVDGDNVEIGQPYLSNVKVSAEIIDKIKAKKYLYYVLEEENIAWEKLAIELNILKLK